MTTSQDTHTRFNAASLIPVALIAAIALFAVNSQSLWIDEFGTWQLTLAPSWSEWFHRLITWPNSDTQIPLYHFYMKVWTSFAGATEYALRFSNVPWVALAIIALWVGPSNGRLAVSRIAAVIVAMHPLTWYYVNEARPYAMILAGTSVGISGLLALMAPTRDAVVERRAIVFVIVGCAFMAATSVLGAIWTVAIAGPAAMLLHRAHGWSFGLRRAHVLLACGLLIVAAPIFVHYVTTFLSGASAAAMGHKLENFAFAFYEIAGVSGLGPGRFELRSSGAGALSDYIGRVVLAAIPIAWVLGAGVHWLWRENRRALLAVLVATAVPLLVLYALGEFKQWRVVGRHVLPLIGTYALLSAYGVNNLWKGSAQARVTVVCRALCVTYVLILVSSSLLLSMSERHGRDDYKAAAAFAQAEMAAGKRVWWAAQGLAAVYYNVDFNDLSCADESDTSRKAFVPLFETPPEALRQCPPPEVVVVSQRDDEKQNVQTFLKDAGYVEERHWIGLDAWRQSSPRP